MKPVTFFGNNPLLLETANKSDPLL